MSRSFAITASSNSVYLDEHRRGEASFTVTNQTGRAIRGRSHLVAEDAAAESWMAVRGPAEREFTTAGTERYMVDIHAPPDAEHGNYTVRLDMVGIERPDDQYVEGPAVTFQVPEEKTQSKSVPIWIPLVTAGVILLGVLFIFWCEIFGCDQRITGTVTDAASGEPLAGATVAVAETNVREETNADGEYAINVSGPEDALLFSFSGYLEKHVEVNDQDLVNVDLSKAEHAAEQVTVHWLDAILVGDVPTLVEISGLPFLVENEILISESEVRSIYQSIVQDVPEELAIDRIMSENIAHFIDEGFIEANDDLLSRMDLSDDDLMVGAFIDGELIGFPFRRHRETVEMVGFRPLEVPQRDDPPDDSPVPVEPEPVPDDPPDEEPALDPQSTTLRDRPPIPLPDREGAMIFGNYSNRDMHPRCIVTNVSADLIGAHGTIRVIEDAVGTNNLHVGVEYSADREMARAEITWEVDHPSGVECTVR